MKSRLSPQILEKYFRGECSEAEIADIHSWYRSFEHDPDDLADLSEQEVELLRQLMWSKITDNIAGSDSGNVRRMRGRRFPLAMFWLSGVAALIAIVFFVKQQALPPAAHPVQNQTAALQVITNTGGGIQKVVLSDSSIVWVSPHSSLTYPRVFAVAKREVTLSGEAFFEVTKDSKRPFSIHSGKVITKVWGTSFRIRSFAADKTTRVNVVTGKVSVAVARPNTASTAAKVAKEVMLLPDQEAVYDSHLQQLQKNTGSNDASVAMWKKANLSFNNAQLKDVFKVLSKNFNVNISSADEHVNNDYLKADFTNENLPAIMNMLEKTLGVSYTVQGNNFVLQAN